MTPIRKTVTVPLRPDAAFDLFTRRIDEWWPVDSHSVSAAQGGRPRKVEVEPREGGRIVETRPDGSRAPWGRVTRWDEGRALGVDWHLGRDEEEATQLTVIFTPVDTGTRVDLVHDGFGRLGEVATAARAAYATDWHWLLGRCYLPRCRARPVPGPNFHRKFVADQC